ncbi:hypothetical protein [Micromonospora matsumotoense]
MGDTEFGRGVRRRLTPPDVAAEQEKLLWVDQLAGAERSLGLGWQCVW